MQAGDGATIWSFRPVLHTKGTSGDRVPGAKVPPLLEEVEFLVGELIWDYEVTLTAEVERKGDGSGQKGWFSSGWGGTWETDVGGEQGRVVVGRAGGRIRMDLCRTDPRLGTGGKVVNGPLELAGDPELGLREQNAGGDDACQEGEEYGRVGTRRGAHLCGQRSEKKSEGISAYKYSVPVQGISMKATKAWEVFR